MLFRSVKRLLIDLKDKIGKTSISAENSFGNVHNTIREEALSALAMLGFSRLQGEKAVAAVLKSDPGVNDVETLIKSALKNL